MVISFIKDIVRIIGIFFLSLILTSLVIAAILDAVSFEGSETLGVLITPIALAVSILILKNRYKPYLISSKKTDGDNLFYRVKICLFVTSISFLGISIFIPTKLSNLAISTLNAIRGDEAFFSSTFRGVVMVIFGIILAPILEELFFRKFLLKVFKEKYGLAFGVIISSFIFMILHGLYLNIFIISMLLSIIYLRHENIINNILVHISLNLSLLLLPLMIVLKPDLLDKIFVFDQGREIYKLSPKILLALVIVAACCSGSIFNYKKLVGLLRRPEIED